MNAETPNLRDERFQPRVDVFHAALALPMPLCREVDDVTRVCQAAKVRDKQFARTEFLAVAHRLVLLVVVWECLSELQGDTTPHDADAVDGIHEGFRVGFHDVAAC